jgi:putative peptidoglycan lipid II flippase
VASTNHQIALSLGGLTGVNILVTSVIHGYVLIVVGPGIETDALFAGAAIPQLLLAVISGSLTQVLVPLLVAEDDDQFRHDAWSFFVVIGAVFTTLAVFLSWSSSFWIPLFFPGLSDAGKSLATELTRIQLIGMVFTGLTGVLMAVHYARQRFLWTECGHLIESLIGLGLLAWALPRYGIKVAAWVSVLRAIVQTLLLLPGLGAYSAPNWGSPVIIKAWHRLKPLFLGTIYYKSGPLVDRFLSSMVPAGGLSLFFLGHQIYGGLNDLINKAVTVPMVPLLVRTAAASNWLSYRRLYEQRLVWVVTVTSVGYLLLLFVGETALALLIGHGGVTADNIRLLWWILLAMGGFLIAGGMGQILAGAFYADGDTGTPATVGTIGFTLGTALKVIGFLQLGLVGLAIGATLHQLFNTMVLYILLEKRFKKSLLPSKRLILKDERGNFLFRDVLKRIVPCPLCAGVEFRILVSNDRYNMGVQTGRCCQCGLVMTNPVPNEEAMRDFYKHHYRRYYSKTETPTIPYTEESGLADRAKYTATYLQERNLFFKGARILDVGCSEGSILKDIKRREPSVEVVGVEPSVAFAQFARDYLGSRVYATLAELSATGESAFHLIIVNHVLEHVENPVHLLTQLKHLMAHDGSIYVDVPDISAYTSLADFHIAHRYHFSIRTLLATVHKADLRVADISRHSPPHHPRSIRCLLMLQCGEPTLAEAELDDGPAHNRIRAISRSSGYYHLRQRFRRLVLRTLNRGRKWRAMGKLLDGMQRVIHRYRRKTFRDHLPSKGYEEQRNEIKFVDLLKDSDLVELNNILDWNCFTLDRSGRRFGNAAWQEKRSRPEVIPDRRILLLHDRFDLATKHVLEIGCFEGIHTIGLCRYAKKVTAVDARIENVVKTIVRCGFFGYCPTVFKCNVEEGLPDRALLEADVACHIGVLYHLKDPVRHLLDLSGFVRLGVLLDTHYAFEEEARKTYEVNGKMYRYKKYREVNSSVFSGIYGHSKWLMLTDIVQILSDSGFKRVDIVETREERNGPRVLLLAQRS